MQNGRCHATEGSVHGVSKGRYIRPGVEWNVLIKSFVC